MSVRRSEEPRALHVVRRARREQIVSRGNDPEEVSEQDQWLRDSLDVRQEERLRHV
jgi:hypothetical protein